MQRKRFRGQRDAQRSCKKARCQDAGSVKGSDRQLTFFTVLIRLSVYQQVSMRIFESVLQDLPYRSGTCKHRHNEMRALISYRCTSRLLSHITDSECRDHTDSLNPLSHFPFQSVVLPLIPVRTEQVQMGFHPLRSESLDGLGDLNPVVLPLDRNPGRYSVRRHD
jgi:hypothetical protein